MIRIFHPLVRDVVVSVRVVLMRLMNLDRGLAVMRLDVVSADVRNV